MDFEIRWTLPAATDFEELAGRITEETDAIQCDEVVQEIFKSVEGLKVHPQIGEKLEKYPQLRRRLVSGFRVIYQIFDEEQVVEITRLLHQRQDIKKHLG